MFREGADFVKTDVELLRRNLVNENVTSRQSRGKRGARTGIAVLSVISLALGSAAHLPGPARAAEAGAAEGSGSSTTFTGGLFKDDGTGVLQGTDLIASDLGAGSCTVTSDKQSFEQAGFKAEIFEPGPGKTPTSVPSARQLSSRGTSSAHLTIG